MTYFHVAKVPEVYTRHVEWKLHFAAPCWKLQLFLFMCLQTEHSSEDPSQDKKESEVEEAAAIIAQRTSNPREFFKQREKAVTCSLDTSPVSSHRTGRLDSPFLKQQHSVCVSSPSSSRIPEPLDDPNEGFEAISPTPIPKIAIQEEKDDNSEKEWAPESPERVPVQESEPDQTDVPQAHPTELKSTVVEDTLLDMWESSPAPTITPCQAPHIMDLMGDADSAPSLPQPLLSFDDVPDVTLCPSAEDVPSSLVDVTESHHMTLSYQPASDSQELDENQELLTNGDSLLKEGTQKSISHAGTRTLWWTMTTNRTGDQNERLPGKEKNNKHFY
ncbi:Drebrin [Bagarius yarrelli]|uniref:Drebrin n=1 Tax=Bagarius yarrelli TaxID=175774 RepID=A0A556UYM6_BAGYA|nr:Drebrin [Bagarius yarrelli]